MSDDKHTELVLEVLKQINEGVAQMGVQMDTRFARNEALAQQANERLARLEAFAENTTRIEREIADLEASTTRRLNNHSDRITSLEARGHRMDGASSVAEWLSKLWPIFAAAFGAVGIYLGFFPK